jgi:hypothetical protein
MTTDTPKFCKDCIHCHHADGTYGKNPLCLKVYTYNLVRGDKIYDTCETQRSYISEGGGQRICGRWGGFFEAKPQDVFNNPKEILNK